MNSINLDNIKMHVINTAPNGVVNHETVFTFQQSDEFITADYAGGKILKGNLVGINQFNNIRFTYCQLKVDGQLDHGESNGELSVNETGRIRMIERFKWREGEMGENIFEEI